MRIVTRQSSIEEQALILHFIIMEKTAIIVVCD